MAISLIATLTAGAANPYVALDPLSGKVLSIDYNTGDTNRIGMTSSTATIEANANIGSNIDIGAVDLDINVSNYINGKFYLPTSGNQQFNVSTIQISGNVLTVTTASTLNNTWFIGSLFTFRSNATATFLNGVLLQVTGRTTNTLTANFVHANYGPTADSGIVMNQIGNMLHEFEDSTFTMT